jgi:hypothetical protein
METNGGPKLVSNRGDRQDKRPNTTWALRSLACSRGGEGGLKMGNKSD